MPEIEIPAGKVFYRDAGEGTPILLVHGNYGSSTWWKPLLGRITGHRTIAPDLPCFGRSAKPESDHRMSTYADYLNDFVEEMGIDEFYLIGHSLGGAITLRHSLDHPQRVKKLVLVDPPPPSGMRFPFFYRLSFKILNRILKGENEIVKNYFSKLVPEDHHLYEELLKDALLMKKSAQEGHADALAEFNVVEELKDLKPPLYVIRGENDSLLDDEDLEEYKKHGYYKVMKNAGHAPFLDAPEEFIKILEENILTN